MSTPRSKKGNGSQDVDPTPALGKTIQRLRKAYNMSLGELSEQSGVAKSIISQIERNETNPHCPRFTACPGPSKPALTRS